MKSIPNEHHVLDFDVMKSEEKYYNTTTNFRNERQNLNELKNNPQC